MGQEQAILRVTTSKKCLWLGLAGVLVAGLFREYDTASLLNEPGRMLINLAVSLALTCLLFLLSLILIGSKRPGFSKLVLFRQLLTGMWMMAPMAVFYAIPVERLTTEVHAIQWNVAFLALVSIWRVWLMSRIMSILLRVPMTLVIFPVLCLCDTILVLVISSFQLSIIELMGGIQLTPEQQAFLKIQEMVLLLAVFSWPLWALITLINLTISIDLKEYSLLSSNRSVTGVCWGMMATGLVVMIAVCGLTQPEQFRAFRIKHLIELGRYQEAMTELNRHDRNEFPPHWQVPPIVWRSHSAEARQILPCLIAALSLDDPQPWIVDHYEGQLGRLTTGYRHRGDSLRFLRERSNQELEFMASLVEQKPEMERRLLPTDVVSFRCFVKSVLDEYANPDFHGRFQFEDRPAELLERLASLSGPADTCPDVEDLLIRIQQFKDRELPAPAPETPPAQ